MATSAIAAPTQPSSDPPDEWECSLQLTNNPRAPGIARTTLRAAMTGYGLTVEVTDTAELLACELVTNAVKHSDGPVFIRARARDGVLRVSVWDNHPELPDPLLYSTHGTFGRGLYLIDRLSRKWGRYPLGHTDYHGTAEGKVVWFELCV
ncbi:ATP-binding protein [Streptomyces gobiensis]|uniref:ATP-binding protein n=1 Tax=Streptomyces gobiensis TaxID=2875706 RepID=UPI001E2B542A|nr:ATP-binding protein [Streptomyces gobiensis]UGY93377.1 ATP-binding protein [Streptomyces gobiensis]